MCGSQFLRALHTVSPPDLRARCQTWTICSVPGGRCALIFSRFLSRLIFHVSRRLPSGVSAVVVAASVHIVSAASAARMLSSQSTFTSNNGRAVVVAPPLRSPDECFVVFLPLRDASRRHRERTRAHAACALTDGLGDAGGRGRGARAQLAHAG